MNDLFNTLNSNMLMKYRALMQNPVQFLMQHKMNIPQEYMNNPEGAIQHLINSGQVSRERVEEAKRYARTLGINI